jgi:hypothetical protein
LRVSNHIPGPIVCFLIFHDFQFSHDISGPTVRISHFSCVSVILAIFHVLQCVFLIFYYFHFSRNTPGPTVCIFHFPLFFECF